MKSLWDGSINFGLVNIPVNLFPAVKSREISFHFLHAKDSGRIHNERVCEVCGKKLSYSEIVKGYEFEKDQFVQLEPEDFEKVNLESAKSIDILDFVPADQIDPMFFDKPYYLVPEKGGQKAYTLLREALRSSAKVGIAKLVFRTRENLAAIHAKGDVLMLDVLHFASELKDAADLEFPKAKGSVNSKELAIAEKLIEQMTTDFNPKKYHDTYEEGLRRLVNQKIKGSVPKGKARRKPATNVIDIMSKLKASLKEKGTKPARPRRKKSA